MSEDTGSPNGLKGKKARKRKRQGNLDDGRKPKKRKSDVDSSAPFDSSVMQNALAETAVYYANGLRYVRPYMFHMKTYAKMRWVGRSILDILKSEFVVESEENYIRAIRGGVVRINNQACQPDTLVNHNDLLSTFLHRHEPPVTAQPLKIVHMDDELLVIDKPCSIPIHPSGRYRHNSLVHILCREHGIFNIHPVHRLDRLTSGVMVMARTPQFARTLASQIQNHDLQKVYLARVEGEFPVESITVDQPIEVKSHKVGLSQISPNGKQSKTEFLRLSYNGHSSVVKCLPRTGRMHQIRIHLQWLGHPIVNDPIYNHPAWKDPSVLHSMDSPLAGVLREILLDESDENKSKPDATMATEKTEAATTHSDTDDNQKCSSTDSSKGAKEIRSSGGIDGQLSEGLSSGVENSNINVLPVVSQPCIAEDDNASGVNKEQTDHAQNKVVVENRPTVGKIVEQCVLKDSESRKDSPTAVHVGESAFQAFKPDNAIPAGAAVNSEVGVGSVRRPVPGSEPRPSDTERTLSSNPASYAQAAGVSNEVDVKSARQSVPDDKPGPLDQSKCSSSSQIVQTDEPKTESSPVWSVPLSSTGGCAKRALDDGVKEQGRKSQTDVKGKQKLADVKRPTIVQPLADPVDIEKYCSWCAGYSLPDPTPKELVMYLHALSYKGDGWEYATSPPDWAADDWCD